jgi:DNA-binding transcriptional ArsR family regulator
MSEHRRDTDLLFKALADPSRRKLLDVLHAHDGRTLNELCEHLDMTRQGVTQHLDVLEAANLVATVRRGREKPAAIGTVKNIVLVHGANTDGSEWRGVDST